MRERKEVRMGGGAIRLYRPHLIPSAFRFPLRCDTYLPVLALRIHPQLVHEIQKHRPSVIKSAVLTLNCGAIGGLAWVVVDCPWHLPIAACPQSFPSLIRVSRPRRPHQKDPVTCPVEPSTNIQTARPISIYHSTYHQPKDLGAGTTGN